MALLRINHAAEQSFPEEILLGNCFETGLTISFEYFLKVLYIKAYD